MNIRNIFRIGFITLAALLVAGSAPAKPPKSGPEPVLLVVLDPLAKELACACVKGYGQRDYRKLSAQLQKAIKEPISIEFSDDLAESMKGVSPEREVIIIGDQSLVAHSAKKAGLKCHPVCALSDLEGNTTLPGLFIARADDSVTQLKDLGGRSVYFGVLDFDDKYAAGMTALRAAGIEPAAKMEKRGGYSEAALDVLDSPLSPPPVAVIPGYALPLLTGCGSVKPGTLKMIGKSEPVPFITVFIGDTMPAEKEQKLLKTLLGLKSDAKMLKLMESRDGFKPLDSEGGRASADANWTDWRGPGRDGHVARLPEKLPATAKFIWKKPAMTGGLAGLSVSGERLILAERDFDEANDIYRCLDAKTGETLWLVAFPARGKLDYGQAPRATPVIRGDKAYLLGAFGELRCVNLADGKVIWKRSLPHEFKARVPTWGMSSTPLVVDDVIIVNPGGQKASLVALDCETGRTRWMTPGMPAAYASFICGDFGTHREIVGYDQHSLGGWDAKTGKRLWQLVPPTEGDFNVPTPIAVDGGIVVCTENNGTRLYHFDESGRIVAKPEAANAELAPSTVSPVATCGRVFGAHQGLHCLDVKHGLKAVWRREEDLGDYATLFADDERVLVVTVGGELILLDARSDTCAIISRLKIFNDDVEIYSHPALVGTRLFVRGGSSVVCMDLGTD